MKIVLQKVNIEQREMEIREICRTVGTYFRAVAVPA